MQEDQGSWLVFIPAGLLWAVLLWVGVGQELLRATFEAMYGLP
jgi:hypothetical protein